VTVELKSGAAIRPVLDVLARLDAWHRVCLAGYHDPWLRAARRLGRAAGVPLFTSMGHTSVGGLRLHGWARQGRSRPDRHGPGQTRPGRTRPVRPTPAVRGDLAQLPHRFAGLTVVDADVLRVAHGGGREVHVWTVDEPGEMTGLLDAGADGIITDRPDLLRDVLRARGGWTRAA
jgi:glycerophosphoryl diester phosphodiesterase